MIETTQIKSNIVIGMGFGDEGKGRVTAWLADKMQRTTAAPSHGGAMCVVRFSGGQQAGHTVVSKLDKMIPYTFESDKCRHQIRHVFSTLGSGTLSGFNTYVSKYCVFDPQCAVNEFRVLARELEDELAGVQVNNSDLPATNIAARKVGGKYWMHLPKCVIDPRVPLTTPYEVYVNRHSDDTVADGTCGMGVWATRVREAAGFSITAGDMRYPAVLHAKLKSLADWYRKSGALPAGVDIDLDGWLSAVDLIIKDRRRLFSIGPCPACSDGLIFEGSQGLLLDQTHGFAPNTTPSDIGLSNLTAFDGDLGFGKRPINMLNDIFFQNNDGDMRDVVFSSDIYLVTRAYQTRHGAGFMTNETLPHNIAADPDETNVTNEWQKDFRRSVLDVDLLNYALDRHMICETVNGTKSRLHLVVTCVDHVRDALCFTENGKLRQFSDTDEFIAEIGAALFDHRLIADKVELHYSDSPSGPIKDAMSKREYMLRKYKDTYDSDYKAIG